MSTLELSEIRDDSVILTVDIPITTDMSKRINMELSNSDLKSLLDLYFDKLRELK